MVTPDPAVERPASRGDTVSGEGYAAIADVLRRQIKDGALSRGDALPSESELTVAHQVARTTVRRALKVLESEGLVDAQQGRGWRVKDPTTSGGPAFALVADGLRVAIARGSITPGTRLPSEKELAETYGCSRGTVRRALVELELQGLIRTQPGVGRFVANARTEARPRTRRAGEQ